MPEYPELAVRGQAHQGLLLQDTSFVRHQVIEECAAKGEEPAVYHGGKLRFFGECLDHVAIQHHLAKLGIRHHPGHGPDATMRAMKVEQRPDIDVRNAVAIGQQKVIGIDQVLDALDASAGHGGAPGVDAADLPASPRVGIKKARHALAQPHRKVTVAGVVINEEVSDHLAFVAEAQNEATETVLGVDVHDVAQDRPAANLGEWFRSVLAFFLKACPFATAEYHYRGVRIYT